MATKKERQFAARLERFCKSFGIGNPEGVQSHLFVFLCELSLSGHTMPKLMDNQGKGAREITSKHKLALWLKHFVAWHSYHADSLGLPDVLQRIARWLPYDEGATQSLGGRTLVGADAEDARIDNKCDALPPHPLDDLGLDLDDLAYEAYSLICDFPGGAREKAEAWLETIRFDPCDESFGVGDDRIEVLSFRASRDRDTRDLAQKVRNRWAGRFSHFKANMSLYVNEDHTWLIPWDHCDARDNLVVMMALLRAAEYGRIDEFNDVFCCQLRQLAGVERIGLPRVPWIVDLLFLACRSRIALASLQEDFAQAMRSIYDLFDRHELPPWSREWEGEAHKHEDSLNLAARYLFAEGIIGPVPGRGELAREAARLLLRRQESAGFWRADRHVPMDDDDYDYEDIAEANDIELTATAIQALFVTQPVGWQGAVLKAAAWLREQQREDGLWEDCGDFPPIWWEASRVWRLVLILDALDLADGKTEVTFDIPRVPTAGIVGGVRANLRTRFEFRSGQVFFDGIDLKVSTGAAIEVLQKLVGNLDRVVPFQELDGDSSRKEASEKLRGAISRLNKTFGTAKIPAVIENRKGEGYVIRSTG